METLVKWAVGLSDGTNAYEGKDEYREIEGSSSPWLRLQEYIKQRGLKITSLCLCLGDKRWNLPSKGNNPKFAEFRNCLKPIGYNFFRKVGLEFSGKNKSIELFSVIEAEYENYKLQTWVNSDGLSSWSLVV